MRQKLENFQSNAYTNNREPGGLRNETMKREGTNKYESRKEMTKQERAMFIGYEAAATALK